jgi:hypothetical protein
VLLPASFLLSLPAAAVRMEAVGERLPAVAEWVSAAVFLVLGSVASVVLTFGAMPATAGGRASFAGLRAVGARGAWAFVAAAIPGACMSVPLPWALALPVQVVAYVATQVVLFVAVPVALADAGAGAAALARSRRLTAGHRGALTFVVVAELALGLVLALPLIALRLWTMKTPAGALGFAGVEAVVGVFDAVAQAVAYALLATPGANRELAAVFE